MIHELGIVDLLKIFGFDPSLKTKLVRHQDNRWDVPTMMRDGWFHLYQSLQARPVFKGCDQIVSFVGDGSGRARLVGVYRVLNESGFSTSLVPDDCPHQEWRTTAKFHYELERQTEFTDLESRVIIDWSSERSWHQHLRNNRVIEIRPRSRVLAPFTDYLDFSLTHAQLRELFVHQTAHGDWYSSLSAVAGVYLVLAQSTGQQYVGSAYGLLGIWGRWREYAANGHGGNRMLIDLIKQNDAYPADFRYSILQVLPKTTTPIEVIRWESEYKAKLGSRVIGLNQAEGSRGRREKVFLTESELA